MFSGIPTLAIEVYSERKIDIYHPALLSGVFSFRENLTMIKAIALHPKWQLIKMRWVKQYSRNF